jgi:hypothetical protein
MEVGVQGLTLSSFKLYHEVTSSPSIETYIGLRWSVRVQLAVPSDAFAVRLERYDLSVAEAQIFGRLAAHGIGADADGESATSRWASSKSLRRA